MFEQIQGYLPVTVNNTSIYDVEVYNRHIKPLTEGQVFWVANPDNFSKALEALGIAGLAADFAPYITINPISDDVVTPSEMASVDISGTTSFVEQGQTVSIEIKDPDNAQAGTATATVGSDGSWTKTGIDMSGYGFGVHTVLADVDDADGNSAPQASITFVLAANPALPEITIDDIAGDNSVTPGEEASVTITGTTTNVEDGQVVKLVIKDDDTTIMHTEDATVTSNAWTTAPINMSSFPDDATYFAFVYVEKVEGNLSANATKEFGTVSSYSAEGAKTVPISEMGLNESVLMKLTENGYKTAQDIAKATATELTAIKGVGEGSIKQIEASLSKHSLALSKGGSDVE